MACFAMREGWWESVSLAVGWVGRWMRVYSGDGGGGLACECIMEPFEGMVGLRWNWGLDDRALGNWQVVGKVGGLWEADEGMDGFWTGYLVGRGRYVGGERS